MTARATVRDQLGSLRTLPACFGLIWRISPALTAATLGLRLVRALLPVATLYIGKLIIDEVVRLTHLPRPPGSLDSPLLLPLALFLLAELALALLADALNRGVSLLDALLADRFSQETSLRIMRHASTLDLSDFEDSETQDRLDRARRQSSGRTGLISLLFGQAQDLVTLAGFAAGIAAYAPWLILLLAAALLPAFVGEARFNRMAYEMSVKQTVDRRELDYLRQTGASTATAKEVKLFGLNGFLVDRYRHVSLRMLRENAAFTVRRATAGATLAALGTVGYYAAYAFLAWRAVTGGLTVGDLTFLAASFLRLRGLLAGVLAGLSSLASQALYLQDLFSFLDISAAIASGPDALPFPAALGSGIVFEDVGFRYPDASAWTVRHLSFSLPAGARAGAGGGERGGQDHVGQVADPALRPNGGTHPGGWAGPARVRPRRGAGRDRGDLPGLRALRPDGGGQHRGGADRAAARPGADRAGGGAGPGGRGDRAAAGRV